MTFGDKVVSYHLELNCKWQLPPGIELLYPFESEEVKKAFTSFFKKYFSDSNKRYYIFGINPGRFGAGITGIPFTDPFILKNSCKIKNPFKKRSELSAIFVYEMIDALGGIEKFYSSFYITSICSLGFVKEGKNYNYYDDKVLYAALESHIVKNITDQNQFGAFDDVALCMGKGKNFKFFSALNNKYKFFKEIIPLPHPRWVMQYRLKSKEEHIDNYVRKLSRLMNS